VIRLLRSIPAVRVSLGIALLASIGMCFVPLLAVHGPESALVLGVLLPPMAAFGSARIVQRLRAAGLASSLRSLMEAVLAYGAVLFAVPLVVLALDSLRIRNCTPLSGLAFMLLGPGFGTLIACLTGLAIALVVPRPKYVATLALAVPVFTMLAAIWRFYASPSIFAYGHYFGFFPGTVYDENVNLTYPFLSLRVGTCVWIATLVLLIRAFTDPATLRVSLLPQSRVALVTGAAWLVAGLSFEVFAVELGHASSVAQIRKTLGGEQRSARCQLYFPREENPKERKRLAEDCDFRVTQAERWLGVTHPEPVTVFLFRSPQEKYALMGAEGTNIAKPWRSEVYISEQGWPNPVLGHEIVHAVASVTGAGPLRVSGKLWGFWPDPALIEGVAVAAAWQPAGGLTPHEWSRALLELDLAPRLSELFGASFLGQQKRLAYTVSGSLLRFVAERWGVRAVRQAYAHGDVAGAVGVTIEQLETEWHRYLRARPISGSALALAEARFTGPSIFSAVCPHALAQLRDELRVALGTGADQLALKTCHEILAADQSDVGARAALVGSLARLGKTDDARRELSWLEQRAPKPYAVAARQALADEAFRRGRYAEARDTYRALLREPLDDDQRRALQVKELATASSDPRERALVFELIVGEPGERADGATAVHLARELRLERSDGLPQYLEARQLIAQARFAHGARLLAEARSAGLPTPELTAEALRIDGIANYAIGDLDASERSYRAFGADGSAAHAAEAEDFLSRIRFSRSRMAAASASSAPSP
jgi:tetratricopeptide (TPR) repeat protein